MPVINTMIKINLGRKEFISFLYTSRYQSNTEIRVRTQGRTRDVITETENIEKWLPIVLYSMVGSVCFLLLPSINRPVVGLPIVRYYIFIRKKSPRHVHRRISYRQFLNRTLFFFPCGSNLFQVDKN